MIDAALMPGSCSAQYSPHTQDWSLEHWDRNQTCYPASGHDDPSSGIRIEVRIISIRRRNA